MPEGAIYTCPMHPEIRQDGPGTCPICGMALVPSREARSVDDSELGTSPVAYGSASCSRSARRAGDGRPSGHGSLGRSGLRLDPVHLGYAGGVLGRLAVLLRGWFSLVRAISTCSR